MIKMTGQGISNIFIEYVMEKSSKHFLGCFSSDKLPKYATPPYSLIVNLSKESERGSHFVGMFQNQKVLYYFDSFGIPCWIEPICDFIKTQSVKVEQNKLSIQSATSEFYGKPLMSRTASSVKVAELKQ